MDMKINLDLNQNNVIRTPLGSFFVSLELFSTAASHYFEHTRFRSAETHNYDVSRIGDPEVLARMFQ